MDACDGKLCSDLSQRAGEDPGGTAAPNDLLIMLEVPLPWPRNVWEAARVPAELFALGEQAGERGLRFRFLMVVPDAAYSRADRRRVVLLRRPEGWLSGYQREEYLVPDESVLPLLREALAESGSLTPFAAFAVDGADLVRDLLVCTHGSMDAACGRYGYPIYERLRRVHASERLRVWRVSHFGGHRFAPTLIDLPDGRWWARLTPEEAEAVVRRSGPLPDLGRCYRGWSGLSTPFEQVLERAIFQREGWGWVGALKQGFVRERDPDGAWAEVCVAFKHPETGRSGLYEGRVEASGGLLSVLATGREPEAVVQYQVTRLSQQR